MRDHPHALNADLMKVGHRIRDLDDASPDTRLTIGDLVDLVEFSDSSYATHRVLNPDWEWTLTNHLIAMQIDFMQIKAWVEGGKKGRRPKPIERPGVGDSEQKKTYKTRKTSTMAEVDAYIKQRFKKKK